MSVRPDSFQRITKRKRLIIKFYIFANLCFMCWHNIGCVIGKEVVNDSQVGVKWYNVQKMNKPISKERLWRTFRKSTELLLSLKKETPFYKEMMAQDICTVM